MLLTTSFALHFKISALSREPLYGHAPRPFRVRVTTRFRYHFFPHHRTDHTQHLNQRLLNPALASKSSKNCLVQCLSDINSLSSPLHHFTDFPSPFSTTPGSTSTGKSDFTQKFSRSINIPEGSTHHSLWEHKWVLKSF